MIGVWPAYHQRNAEKAVYIGTLSRDIGTHGHAQFIRKPYAEYAGHTLVIRWTYADIRWSYADIC
jgi:hypothetical protein